ncbi:MAG: alpha/beta hydrolase [Patescibacteria group bacterium]
MKMLRNLLIIAALAVISITAAQATQPAEVIHTNRYVLTGIPVQTNLFVNIEIIVLDAGRNNGDDITCLHGLVHTADTFLPIGTAMLHRDKKIHSVILINRVGHGGSSLPYGPAGVVFGDITVDDESTVLLGVIDRLTANGADISELIAHSLAGSIALAANDKLVAAGTSFSKLGIEVKPVNSTFPAEISDPIADSGYYDAVLLDPANGYLQWSAETGFYVTLDPYSFLYFFLPPTTTLTPEDLVSLGYIDKDPLGVTLGVLGMANERISIQSGGFSRKHGKDITFSVGQNDGNTDLEQTRELSKYVTAGVDRVVVIRGGHSSYIDMPYEIAEDLGH